MADDDALIAYRLNIPINELTPADRERYASMRSRMVPRRVAERQQMLREREAQRRQSRANDPERDALIAYRLGIPANELTDADRARYESQRGGSLFGRSTPQAQPQPRSPFRQAIDTTVRNLGAVGGIMNPALPGQLERQLIGRETPQAAVPARPQQNAPMPRSRQPMAATTMPAERQAAQAMMMEANQPAGAGQAAPPPRPARRSRPMSQRRPRETSADDLNAISLAFARGERPRGGAADTIGKALGIEGYKKGGLVKPKAPVKKAMGGMIKAPKKPAVPGRGRGRPATAVKAVSTKPMAKAAKPKMPAFKKGGSVSMKKGKK